MADIISINEPWDGQHTGDEIERFLKQQLVSIKANADSKIGYVEYSSGRIAFYEDNSKETLVGDVVLSGVVYNVEITASEPNTFNVLSSDTSKTLTFSAKSFFSPIGQAVMNPFVEDYTFTASVDSGTGIFVEKQSGSFRQTDEVSLQIRSWLTTGENRLRIAVTGMESHQQSVKIFTVNVTSLTLDVAFSWYKPWVENETFMIDGIKFSGNLQKTLYVAIDNNSSIIDPITFPSGTNYISSAYSLDVTQYFPEIEESGIHTVDIWMEGGGVRTSTFHFNVMCVKQEEKNTAKLIVINNAKAKASNFVAEDLFDYAVYNSVSATFESVVTDGNQTITYTKTISGLQTRTKNTFVSTVEFETEELSGVTLTVTASVEDFEQELQLPLDNSTAFVPTPGATFYMNSSTRSNGSTDRLKIINQATTGERDAEYLGTWTGFSFGNTDGWTVDGENNLALVAKAGCHLSVPGLKVLSGTATGSITVELKFKSDHVADYETPVLTFAQKVNGRDCGIFLYPTRLVVLASSAQNEILQRIGLQEGVIHHIVIVFQQNYNTIAGRNICSIYMNGNRNIHFAYDGDASFGDGNLEIGQDSTDFYLYMMRFYEPATGGYTGVLDSAKVLSNFINTIIDGAEFKRAGVRDDNNIIDSGTVNYEMAKKAGYNIMVVETNDYLPSINYPESTGKTCKLHLWYGSDNDQRNFSVTNCALSGQGTTSMQYYRWNLRFKTKDLSIWTYYDNTTSTGKKGWFDGKDAHPKVADIVAKKNYASAMQGHKMGAVGMYNDLYKKVVGTSGLPADARVAVYQYPVLGFQKINDEYVYIGLYTIGPHKGDKGTFGYNADNYPALMSLEGPNHAPLGTRFLHAWQNVDYDYAHETLTFGGEEGWDADFCAGLDTDVAANHDAIMALYESEWRPAYEIVFFCSQYLVPLSDTNKTLAQINADVDNFRMGTTDGIKNNLIQIYDENYSIYAYNNYTKSYVIVAHNMLSYLADYLDGSADPGKITPAVDPSNPTRAELVYARAKKFQYEASNYWATDSLLFHSCFCTFIGATDNFAKNMYPFKFNTLDQGGRWAFRQDDLDSILDTDNNGQQTKRYSALPGDVNLDGVQIFQGGDSALYALVETAFAGSINNMMQRIVSAARTIMGELEIRANTLYEIIYKFFEHYFWSQSAKYFPQEAYNKDTEWSYIEPWLIDPSKQYNNVYPLTQTRGDGMYSEREWVIKRIAFIFSRYRIGGFTGDSAEYGQFAFTPIQPYTFNIVPAIDLCPVITRGADDVVGALTRAGEVCPINVLSTGETNAYLHGTDWLSYYGDMCGLLLTDRGGQGGYAPAVNFTGKRLRKIKVGDADAANVLFNADGLTVSNTPALEEIDARNVVKFRSSVNLSSCSRLRKVLFGGSSATGLILPEGAQLTEVSLPEQLGTLFLRSLPTIDSEKLSMSSTAEMTITGLYIYNCPNLNPIEYLIRLWESGGNLQYITLMWDYELIGSADYFNTLYHIARNEAYVDEVEGEIVTQTRVYGYVNYENGTVQNMAGTPIIEGSLFIDDFVNATEFEMVQATWPNLTIECRGAIIDFEDPIVKEICVTNWGGETGGSTGVAGKAGEITTAQAAAVSSIGTVFKGNTDIVILDLRPFTKIVNMDRADFAQNMTALKTIYFPSNLVDNRASSSGDSYPYCTGCTALQKAVLPPSCKRIHCNQFNISGGNTTIVVGDAYHGSDLLSVCSYNLFGNSIKNLILFTETPPYWHSANSANFAQSNAGSIPSGCKIYVPDAAVNTYKNSGARYWGNFASRIYPISEFEGEL